MSRMLSFLLMLVFVAAVAIVIRASVGRRGAGAGSADPRCGRCGYIVRGISTLTCPECGSDLREVGIVAPGTEQASWGPVAGLAFLWTLVVFVLASLLATAMQQVMPRWIMATHVVSLSGPSSGAYRSVVINASGEYRVSADPVADPYEPDAVVELHLNDGTIATLRADVGAGTFSYRAAGGPEVKGSGPLDGAVVVKWMTNSGVSGNVGEEAAQVAAEVRAQPPDRRAHAFSSSRSGYAIGGFKRGQDRWTGQRSGIEWASLAPPALGLIGWIFGLRWIIARHRRYASGGAPAEALSR